MNIKITAIVVFVLVLTQLGVNDARAGSSKQAAANKASQQRAAASAARNPVVELDRSGNPVLGSAAFVVARQSDGEVLVEKKGGAVVPIASITKLMTAMVVLDARQSLSEVLTITSADIDQLKGTGSRLSLGTRMTREEMLNIALMSSENRAASALARHYPGGERAFIAAMNVKARMIGLWDTRFADSTGLDPRNVSSPRDLVRLVSAAAAYPLIREFSTTQERHVKVGGRLQRFGNTNGLVRDPDWRVSLSKTGYIREAGRCLVMQAWIGNEPVIIVLMDSQGSYTRIADAKRVKYWLETAGAQRMAVLAQGRHGS